MNKKVFKFGVIGLGLLASFLCLGSLTRYNEHKTYKAAEAATSNVTNGTQRINVVLPTDNAGWVDEANGAIQMWDGSYDRNLKGDTDLGSFSKENYNLLTVGGTSCYFVTQEYSSTQSGIMYLKRFSPDFKSNWGKQVEENVDANNNTIMIYGSTPGGSDAKQFGNYFKVAYHVDSSTTIYRIEYAGYKNEEGKPVEYFTPQSSIGIDNAPSGKTFAGWCTDAGLTTLYSKSVLTGDINLYAKYDDAVTFTMTDEGNFFGEHPYIWGWNNSQFGETSTSKTNNVVEMTYVEDAPNFRTYTATLPAYCDKILFANGDQSTANVKTSTSGLNAANYINNIARISSFNESGTMVSAPTYTPLANPFKYVVNIIHAGNERGTNYDMAISSYGTENTEIGEYRTVNPISLQAGDKVSFRIYYHAGYSDYSSLKCGMDKDKNGDASSMNNLYMSGETLTVRNTVTEDSHIYLKVWNMTSTIKEPIYSAWAMGFERRAAIDKTQASGKYGDIVTVSVDRAHFDNIMNPTKYVWSINNTNAIQFNDSPSTNNLTITDINQILINIKIVSAEATTATLSLKVYDYSSDFDNEYTNDNTCVCTFTISASGNYGLIVDKNILRITTGSSGQIKPAILLGDVEDVHADPISVDILNPLIATATNLNDGETISNGSSLTVNGIKEGVTQVTFTAHNKSITSTIIVADEGHVADHIVGKILPAKTNSYVDFSDISKNSDGASDYILSNTVYSGSTASIGDQSYITIAKYASGSRRGMFVSSVGGRLASISLDWNLTKTTGQTATLTTRGNKTGFTIETLNSSSSTTTISMDKTKTYGTIEDSSKLFPYSSLYAENYACYLNSITFFWDVRDSLVLSQKTIEIDYSERNNFDLSTIEVIDKFSLSDLEETESISFDASNINKWVALYDEDNNTLIPVGGGHTSITAVYYNAAVELEINVVNDLVHSIEITTSEGDACFKKVTKTPSNWEGQYLIVYSGKSQNRYMAARTQESAIFGIGCMSPLDNSLVDFGTTDIFTITSETDDKVKKLINETIEFINIDNNLFCKFGDYYYYPNNSTEVGRNKNINLAKSIDVSIDNNGYFVWKNPNDEGRQLAQHPSNFGDLRFYKNSGEAIQLYKYYPHGVTTLDDTDSNGNSAALNIAHEFLQEVGCEVCNAQGNTDLTTLQSVWANIFSDSNKYYAALSDTSKLMLDNATPDANGDTIQQAVALYDYIVYKYGSIGELNDSLERNGPSERKTPTKSKSNSAIFSKTDSIILITSIGLISATALGAFLIIRKRKEDK